MERHVGIPVSSNSRAMHARRLERAEPAYNIREHRGEAVGWKHCRNLLQRAWRRLLILLAFRRLDYQPCALE